MLYAADLLVWFEREGVLPLPCEPRSKVPLKQISSDGVYGWGLAPEGDSYHVASPERIELVRNWWKNRDYFTQTGPRDVAMSIDCTPEFHGGRRVFGIDVDRDDLYSAVMNEPALSACPAVCGKKGVKLIGFIETGSDQEIPAILQWYDADPDHPALEVFTNGKHMLVYGEHPDSTASNRIFYQFVRGFGCPFPSLSWSIIICCVEHIADEHGLQRSSTISPAHCTNLEMPKISYSPGLTRTDRLGLRLEDVCIPNNPQIHGMNIYGENPVHGSSTGKNLHVNVATQRWYCHRCGVGGGVNAWLQVKYAADHGYKSTTLCRDVFERLEKT